jgi:hypothetical protein
MPKANPPASAACTEMRRADSAEAVPPMTGPPPVPRQRHIVSPRLERVAFRTSRLLDFIGRRELTAQIGHPPEHWPLVIVKELTDNALDACEEAEIAPEIEVRVNTATGGQN